VSNPLFLQALEQARLAALAGEVPVGAVVANAAGEVIAAAHNRVVTDKDPTAHAELLAIRAASHVLGNERLHDCDLYVTLEPCPMCAQAISFARLRRVYFGAYDEKGGGVENGARIFSQSSCHHTPEIYGGLYETECSDMLKDFFKQLR
jgi:tRNA(Arg) A34 adenosine deaminase TadA